MRLANQVLRIVAVSAVALVVLVLGACGSSKSAGSPDTAPAVADGAGTSGPVSSGLAAAQALVAGFTKPPTAIAQTQALAAAPPRGKTFIWLNCAFPACSDVGNGIKAAVSAAGWTYQQVNYTAANPATLTAAFRQALAMHPTVVGMSGTPPTTGWSSIIPAYRAAGVPIITSALGPIPLDPIVIANVGGVFTKFAQEVANWFIADSRGHGKALIERIDSLPVLKTYSDALVADIKAGCPACDVSTVLENSVEQIGSNGIVPATISALKRDPSLHYVLPSDLLFFDSLPSAMRAAGLSVKVAGSDPTIAALGYLKTGTYQAAATHPLAQMGWVMADAAFHYAMGTPIPAEDNGPLPSWLITPSADFPTDKVIEYPTDYQSQFKKLWHLN
jgi:ribose transport system substrate-binding protein